MKFDCRRFGRMLVWQKAGEDHAGLLEHLLPDPDELLASGELLPGRGRGCQTARITIAGRVYLLKRYAYRNIWYGFRHVFKRSRPLKVFINQNLALAAGVSVPRPLLCLEERTWCLLRRSYVLDSYLHDSQQLDQCWGEASLSQQAEILRLAAENFRLLHQAGIMHGDTNWRNLLVSQAEGRPKVWLIDFDNSTRPRIFIKRRRQRDIGHFIRDMHYRQMTDESVALFCSAAGISLPMIK